MPTRVERSVRAGKQRRPPGRRCLGLLLIGFLACSPSAWAQVETDEAPARENAQRAANGEAAAGPWPDPVQAEADAQTLPLPTLQQDAAVQQEALPEIQSGYASVTATPTATDALHAAADTGPPDLRLLYDWPGQAEAGPPPIEPAADPESFEFIGPRVVSPFRLLGADVEPGTRTRLYWNASQTYAGGEMRTPVEVIHGDRIGPVLCLTGAVHGDELNGVEVVRRMLRDLSPQPLAGTVIGVPVVNLFGFSRNSRYLPDRRDLNRFFPGSPTGSIASRIAHSFFDQVVRHCDALVDMHTGSFDRINLPQVRADLRIPHVLEFTRGFGATPVLHSPGSRGMLRVAATQAGIPSVTFEVGGPGELEPREIDAGVQALLTLVHKLGMVRDSPAWAEPQAIFYESRWVRADRGGMLISDVALGERVQRGQRIGLIVDPLENTEHDIVASVSGRVIGMALNQVVLPGYAIYHLGEETSETGAVSQAASGAAVLPYEEDAGRPPASGEPALEELEDTGAAEIEGLPPEDGLGSDPEHEFE